MDALLGKGFNPHPARGPGESSTLDNLAVTPEVSIRTRPEGRVNRVSLPARLRHVGVSIRTRPEGRVNLLRPFSCGPGCRCFNPHPARGPGESHFKGDVALLIEVSIRTRPEGRVNPGAG